jgi:hypothetical protein
MRDRGATGSHNIGASVGPAHRDSRLSQHPGQSVSLSHARAALVDQSVIPIYLVSKDPHDDNELVCLERRDSAGSQMIIDTHLDTSGSHMPELEWAAPAKAGCAITHASQQ